MIPFKVILKYQISNYFPIKWFSVCFFGCIYVHRYAYVYIHMFVCVFVCVRMCLHKHPCTNLQTQLGAPLPRRLHVANPVLERTPLVLWVVVRSD